MGAFENVDEDMVTDLLMKSMTASAASDGVTGALDLALAATPAGPALDAAKLVFHYACMKYDEDGYGVWAQSRFEEKCDIQDCAEASTVDWRYCSSHFPNEFLGAVESMGCEAWSLASLF